MSIITYPLNNIEYDFADAALYNCTRTSGIYAGTDFGAAVTGADNSVTINPGLAWVSPSRWKGMVAAHKLAETLDIGLQGSTNPRIDAIVLRYDANANETTLTVKKGAEASSPVPPARVTSEAVYELHLYHVLRRPTAAAITAGDITDLRLNPDYCGLMADAVTVIDTAAINAQFQALLGDLRMAIEDAQSGVLPDGSVTSAKLATSAVTTEKLANRSVTADKLEKSYFDADSALILTQGVHYGTSLPSTPTAGRLFFVKVT